MLLPFSYYIWDDTSSVDLIKLLFAKKRFDPIMELVLDLIA
jgi:hypothetical protein